MSSSSSQVSRPSPAKSSAYAASDKARSGCGHFSPTWDTHPRCLKCWVRAGNDCHRGSPCSHCDTWDPATWCRYEAKRLELPSHLRALLASLGDSQPTPGQQQSVAGSSRRGRSGASARSSLAPPAPANPGPSTSRAPPPGFQQWFPPQGPWGQPSQTLGMPPYPWGYWPTQQPATQPPAFHTDDDREDHTRRTDDDQGPAQDLPSEEEDTEHRTARWAKATASSGQAAAQRHPSPPKQPGPSSSDAPAVEPVSTQAVLNELTAILGRLTSTLGHSAPSPNQGPRSSGDRDGVARSPTQKHRSEPTETEGRGSPPPPRQQEKPSVAKRGSKDPPPTQKQGLSRRSVDRDHSPSSQGRSPSDRDRSPR